jgi:hypothetical protein
MSERSDQDLDERLVRRFARLSKYPTPPGLETRLMNIAADRRRLPRKRLIEMSLATASVAAVVVVAGVAMWTHLTGTTPPAASGASSSATAAKLYLAAAGNYDAVVDQANSRLKAGHGSDVVPVVHDLIKATQDEEAAITAIHVQDGARADVTALVDSLQSNVRMLQQLIAGPMDVSQWLGYVDSAAATSQASGAVRHDLGLPARALATPGRCLGETDPGPNTCIPPN